MIKKLSELKPYKSLLLARVQGSIPVENIVDGLLVDIRELLSLGKMDLARWLLRLTKSTQASWPSVIYTT